MQLYCILLHKGNTYVFLLYFLTETISLSSLREGPQAKNITAQNNYASFLILLCMYVLCLCSALLYRGELLDFYVAQYNFYDMQDEDFRGEDFLF